MATLIPVCVCVCVRRPDLQATGVFNGADEAMIAHPGPPPPPPSQPGPDTTRPPDRTPHKVYLCAHKSRFTGDNPMTANLLQGYVLTYLFHSLFIHSLCFYKAIC